MNKTKIAIIGAGVSGLTCAQELTKNTNLDICIFEKSRGVGGRTATRRSGDYRFDLGFQVFQEPLAEKYHSLMAQWGDKIAPIPSSNSYCKQLAANVNVKTNIEIKSIERSHDLWTLRSLTDSYDGFDYVLLTAPPPQTYALLPDTSSIKKIVSEAEMSPCFSFMIAYTSFVQLPWTYLSPTHPVFQWVSHQSTLPERHFDNSVFVAHTTPTWSKKNLETPVQELEAPLLDEFEVLTGIGKQNIESLSVHRWRYALTEKPVGKSYLIDEKSKLGICGDWLLGNTFLDAHTSALALANELLRII
jgi:renalase